MLGGNTHYDFLPLSENINNEIANSILKFSVTKKEKQYLNHKRKRISDNVLTDVKKLIDEEDSKFKLQDFSKYVLSVIFSFLSFDELLKLKNVGCRNIHNYIIELFGIKRSKGCFKFKLMKSIKTNVFLSDKSSSNLSKNYLFSNLIDMVTVPSLTHIKYMIYHKQSNKYYFLLKQIFNYYFCSCDKNEVTENGNMNYNILIKIKELEYVHNFQFIDDNKVVFFSLNTILLYDISNDLYKYNIIYLSHTCDFILFKKNLNLLVVPHSSYQFISFFDLNKAKTKKIKKEKCKITIMHEKNCSCENAEIVDICENLICYFCPCFNYVKIIDCKKMKFIEDIKLNSNVKNVELNNKYLIVYTADNSINFFDKLTLDKRYNFKLGNCGIKKILLFEPSYFHNIFLVIKNNNESCLMYIESDKYFSYVLIDNEICIQEMKNNKFITNSFNNQTKDDDDIMLEIKTKLIYTEYPERDYIINDYSLIL